MKSPQRDENMGHQQKCKSVAEQDIIIKYKHHQTASKEASSPIPPLINGSISSLAEESVHISNDVVADREADHQWNEEVKSQM